MMKTSAIVVVAVMVSLLAIAPSFANETTWRQIYTRAGELNQMGKPVEALDQATVAAREAENRFGKNSINLAKSLELVAQIVCAQDPSQAAQLYNRSLAIQEKILGASHPRVIKTMCALADLNAQQDRLFEARALYHKARAIAEAADRADDLDTAVPLAGLAKLSRVSGNYVECGQLCRRIVAIYQKYTKYQPSLAVSVSGALQQLAEVSSLHEAKAQP